MSESVDLGDRCVTLQFGWEQPFANEKVYRLHVGPLTVGQVYWTGNGWQIITDVHSPNGCGYRGYGTKTLIEAQEWLVARMMEWHLVVRDAPDKAA